MHSITVYFIELNNSIEFSALFYVQLHFTISIEKFSGIAHILKLIMFTAQYVRYFYVVFMFSN